MIYARRFVVAVLATVVLWVVVAGPTQVYLDTRGAFFSVWNRRDNINLKRFLMSGFETVSVRHFDTRLAPVEAHREAINSYAIVRSQDALDAAERLARGDVGDESLLALLRAVLPHVRLRGEPVREQDCVVADVISAKGQYFQSLHTDIEWALFDNSHGFQVWVLLHNDEQHGNMFILDTDRVRPASYVRFFEDGEAEVRAQCGDGVLSPRAPITGTAKYLEMRRGDVFLFGQNVFHSSDVRPSRTRHAVNLRVLLREPDGGVQVNREVACGYAVMKRMTNLGGGLDSKIYPGLTDLATLV